MQTKKRKRKKKAVKSCVVLFQGESIQISPVVHIEFWESRLGRRAFKAPVLVVNRRLARSQFRRPPALDVVEGLDRGSSRAAAGDSSGGVAEVGVSDFAATASLSAALAVVTHKFVAVFAGVLGVCLGHGGGRCCVGFPVFLGFRDGF